jgi:hypothetical protein
MCVEILHTHCLINISINSFKLKAQIELNSISMSKNDPKITEFEKYDVEATIDEVDNNDELSVYKYGFTALSNPKNVRLSIEGVARISGDTIERNEILEKDENDVPKILSMIYQELFPTFFLLSKTMNVSCPPHQIGAMGTSLENDVEVSDEKVEVSDEKVEVSDEKVEVSDEKVEVSDENDTSESESEQEASVESETDIKQDSEEQETPDVVQPTV